MSKLIALYHGSIRVDAFYFAPIINGRRVRNVILDTGAFEPTLNAKVASILKLPNLGPIEISAVGGTVQAYRSRCSIRMWKHIYRDVPCIVHPALQEQALFGLRFFIDHDLNLTLNPKAATLAVRKSM
ncbi:retroviral-like aspartic protease family protein [Alicyclobacillus fastidiosus]|uniref:Retroviral-like aspartic protease family protein n=1 Tax=Alicyclobacillus fastidiosus TaxID=392011 RepID=A0ABY6ZGU9_9BACL|nr:retropepsin-like aspartic protease [Alicyclobacillus fastidiosus]WAH41823.1 retroviral-like aspartic protease family protein [Alicyclobacillus fastidiosus]GMA63521.1 hypothetical protein GCM10025859_39610 [Alicyclobacillus fastidiosus]